MDKQKILDDIFGNDPLNILNVKPKASSARSADDRLLASFQEINDFVAAHGKEPEPNAKNVAETQLYYRLKSMKEDEEKVSMLKEEDVHNILPSTTIANVRVLTKKESPKNPKRKSTR